MGSEPTANERLEFNAEMDSELKPTKMGSLLADRVTQKVIMGVLLAILILPLFDVGNMDQGDKTFIALEDLEYIYTAHHNVSNGAVLTSHAADYNHSMLRFDAYHPNVLFLQVGSSSDNFSRIEHDSPNPSLRFEEQTEYFSESEQSHALLNIRQSVQQEAILNICLTSFIMSIFAIGSFVISIDAFILVYPLEYLVVVLKRLTAIAVQKAVENEQELKAGNDNQLVDDNQLFSSIMKSMTDIFYSGKREKMFINLSQNKRSSVVVTDNQASVSPPKGKSKVRHSMELVNRISKSIVGADVVELDMEMDEVDAAES